MMNTIAGMGLAGSAVLALWLLASGVLKNRLPAQWHYRILKTSLFFFLVPVGRILSLVGRVLAALRPVPTVSVPAPLPAPAAPNIPVTVIPQAPVTVSLAPAPAPVPAPEPFAFSGETLRVLAVVWALGAAAVLAYKAYVYVRLRRDVFRLNRPVSSREAQLVFWSCKRQLGIRGPVALRENPAIRSPFAAGLWRPTVVIPNLVLEPEELRYLFLHELTHIKRGDLWVRFWAMLALAIHWYNPLAYLLCRNIRTVSEQSCDERVACPLPAAERYVYGNVILKLVSSTAAGSGDWVASLSTRETMERRLIRVLRTEKLKGCKRLLALALAAVILACGGGAALAARNPLPVSKKEAAEPPRTVPVVQTEDAGKSGANAVKPAAAPAPAADPREDGAEEPEEPKEEKPVTTNGTPSEAFLKELREYFTTTCHVPGITEDTPVLFGDHELIVSRGGTLLPDEEFSSYTCAYGGSENSPPVIYKEFYTKSYIGSDGNISHAVSEEYFVGNKDELDAVKLKNLGQLVNGELPKNSRGESYGSESFGRYVGYYPDLISARGTRGEEGYIYRPDEGTIPHNLPKDECPHEFLIPLYDSEHREIGKFEMCCGGHMMEDIIAKNMSVEEAKAALASGELSYGPTYDDPSANVLELIRAAWKDRGATAETPVLFGNPELIVSRGGTILPDDDLSAYMMVNDSICKLFVDRNGTYRREYLVGSKNLIDPREAGLLDSLTPDGDYPKNSKGESYGHMNLADYVGYWPDMEYLAEYPYENRPAGYIYSRDVPGSPLVYKTTEERAAYSKWREENPGPIVVPLYDSQGEVIGEYSFGEAAAGPSTAGMSVEEAKAALALAVQ